MKIDLTHQIAENPLFPAGPLVGYSGSSVLAELCGVPAALGGGTVAGVAVSLTLPDGIPVTAPAEKVGSEWHVLFAAANFTCYGVTRRGFKAVATIQRDNGTIFPYTLGIGNLRIDPGTPDAQPGDPMKNYVVKGDEVYLKSQMVQAGHGVRRRDWLGRELDRRLHPRRRRVRRRHSGADNGGGRSQ